MRKSKRINVVYLILIITSIQLSTLVSAATTVIFSPTDDTMIKNENPSSQSGYSWTMAVRNAYGASGMNNFEIDSLLHFDIFSIPSSATVLSASLHLYYYNWSGTDPAGRNLSIYLITSSWTEEYVNWKTQPSYAMIPSSSSTVPDSTGQWMTWNLTNDVQSLVHERAYYGWKIVDENNWKQSDIPLVNFRTKEYGNYLPYLEVTYTISEANNAPNAGFSTTPLNPTTEDMVQFMDTSYDPDGTITGWLWDFGDGSSATSRTPTHTYTTNGQYTVTLQVTDNDRATNTITGSITITKSTPGFEILLVACAMILVLLIKFKGRKRN